MKIEIHARFELTSEQREWATRLMEEYQDMTGRWVKWSDKLYESGITVPLKGVDGEKQIAEIYLSKKQAE